MMGSLQTAGSGMADLSPHGDEATRELSCAMEATGNKASSPMLRHSILPNLFRFWLRRSQDWLIGSIQGWKNIRREFPVAEKNLLIFPLDKTISTQRKHSTYKTHHSTGIETMRDIQQAHGEICQ